MKIRFRLFKNFCLSLFAALVLYSCRAENSESASQTESLASTADKSLILQAQENGSFCLSNTSANVETLAAGFEALCKKKIQVPFADIDSKALFLSPAQEICKAGVNAVVPKESCEYLKQETTVTLSLEAKTSAEICSASIEKMKVLEAELLSTLKSYDTKANAKEARAKIKSTNVQRMLSATEKYRLETVKISDFEALALMATCPRSFSANAVEVTSKGVAPAKKEKPIVSDSD